MGELLNLFKLMRTPSVDEKPVFLVDGRVTECSGNHKQRTYRL